MSGNPAFEMEQGSQSPGTQTNHKMGVGRVVTSQPIYFQGVAHVVEEDSAVISTLKVFLDLDKFAIAKTSQSTRIALSTTGQNLFSYSEQVIVNTLNVTMGTIFFHDTSGVEILACDVDTSATRIKSRNVQLGVLDAMKYDWVFAGNEVRGNSSIGLGQIAFVPEIGDRGPRKCICCDCGWTKPGLYKVLIGSTPVGEVKSTEKGKAEVEFKPDLDVRLKAIIIVGSFMLYNCLWYK